jgi:hypothetical protein
LNNLELNLNQENGNYYEFSINSDINGDFYVNVEGLPQISGFLKQTTINGNLIIEKNNLGIKDFNFNIDGILRISIVPINLDINMQINFNASYVSIDFPLEVGNQWTINESEVNIQGLILLPGIAQLFPNVPDEILIENATYYIGGDNAICNNKENITISSGFYETYNISIDDSLNIYYSPVLGNIVKIIPKYESEYYDFQFNFELISTSYLIPGAPNKPNIPEGPNKGEPEIEYTFSTSTTDNEGDDIYYLFDWNDGSNSGWIGPYNSGEIITMNHTWAEKGTYRVKVKAKDTNNNESPWSDPLYISIPKIKIFNFKVLIKNLIQDFMLNYQ